MLRLLIVLMVVTSWTSHLVNGQIAIAVKAPSGAEAPESSVVRKRIEDIRISAAERGLPWWCNVDLGTLTANKKFAFELVIIPDHDMEFTSVRTSCQCHRFDLIAGQLKAGQKHTAHAAFKVAGGSETGAGGLTATLLNGDREVGMIVMNYRIASSLYLDSTSYMQIDESVSEFNVPFRFTLPFKLSDFEVSGKFQNSDPLLKIEGRPAGANGVAKAVIQGSLDAASIDNVDVGAISLKHIPSGRVKTSSIILVKNPLVSVVPRSLAFLPSDSVGSDGMVSKCMVRLDQRLKDEIGKWDHFEVFASGPSGKVRVATKKFNSTLYRVVLNSSRNAIQARKAKDQIIKFEFRFSRRTAFSKSLTINQNFYIEGDGE
jgi:hypothetical protein